jgi:hypothetical protein
MSCSQQGSSLERALVSSSDCDDDEERKMSTLHLGGQSLQGVLFVVASCADNALCAAYGTLTWLLGNCGQQAKSK